MVHKDNITVLDLRLCETIEVNKQMLINTCLKSMILGMYLVIHKKQAGVAS